MDFIIIQHSDRSRGGKIFNQHSEFPEPLRRVLSVSTYVGSTPKKSTCLLHSEYINVMFTILGSFQFPNQPISAVVLILNAYRLKIILVCTY